MWRTESVPAFRRPGAYETPQAANPTGAQDDAARRSLARKRQFGNAVGGGQRRAGFFTKAMDNVHNACPDQVAAPSSAARNYPHAAAAGRWKGPAPGGRMSLISSITMEMETGVCSAGLMTTTFPAASAGASFQVAMSKGWHRTPGK